MSQKPQPWKNTLTYEDVNTDEKLLNILDTKVATGEFRYLYGKYGFGYDMTNRAMLMKTEPEFYMLWSIYNIMLVHSIPCIGVIALDVTRKPHITTSEQVTAIIGLDANDVRQAIIKLMDYGFVRLLPTGEYHLPDVTKMVMSEKRHTTEKEQRKLDQGNARKKHYDREQEDKKAREEELECIVSLANIKAKIDATPLAWDEEDAVL